MTSYIQKICFKVILFCASFRLLTADVPIVITTWGFQHSTQKAWSILRQGDDFALDALQAGCEVCQNEQCDHTVGYGGSPDEHGETTLDGMVFDGDTIDMGAVGGLRNIKNAIGVARKVLQHTEHSLLVGSLATQFAESFNFPRESLETNYSRQLWEQWKKKDCQPNFWKNMQPDPKKHCGPYNEPHKSNQQNKFVNKFNTGNHDTIGMIVISKNGHAVAGTSTNGATFKIPGRVGDSPIPGAGAYADSRVGAAAASGDGDIMMRFLPSFLAVEQMRLGASPTKAAKIAIDRIAEKYPAFFGGIIVADNKGNLGAACNGMEKFPFVVASDKYSEGIVKYVTCSKIYDL